MNKALLLLVPIALAGCQAENHADGQADAHGNHTVPQSDAMDMSKTAHNESPATLKVSFVSEGGFMPNKAQAITLMLADA